MNKIAWAVALVVIVLLGWTWLAGPALDPPEDPFLTLRKQAERSQTLEEKREAGKHFRLMLEQTEQAMIRDGLSLRKAAELLLHYGLDHDDFLRTAHVRGPVESRPDDDAPLLEHVAFVLVRRARQELQASRNRAGYTPEYLQRLEGELRNLRSARASALAAACGLGTLDQ